MKQTIAVALFIFLSLGGYGQITPPGLGRANTASWFAVGIRQELDTIPGLGWQSMTYAGIGRKSEPDNNNLLDKQAIIVLNQEFFNQFKKEWQYSLAVSYRRQDQYSSKVPYEHGDPYLKQEFRVYSRLSYIFKTSRIRVIPLIRQEVRKFYTADFEEKGESLQLRSRFRLQLSVNLTADKVHKLVANSEQLFAVSKAAAPGSWGSFAYKESRFSVFYSISPKKLPFIFDVGYMNNLVGSKNVFDVHYLAFDVIIKNPFKQVPH